MNVWDPIGNWAIDSIVADSFYIGGNSANSYSDMILFELAIQNGTVLQRGDVSVFNGTELTFQPGFHLVNILEFASGCQDSFFVHVACIQNDTIQIDTLFENASDIICLDFSELQMDVVSVSSLCPAGDNVIFSLINGDSCVLINTVTPGVDTACFLACDDLGFCDTTYIIIDVQDLDPSQFHEFNIEIDEDVVGTQCLNLNNLTTGVDTFYNICESNGSVVFTFNPANYCVDIFSDTGNVQDTFCMVICDSVMVCDTNFVYVDIKRVGPDVVNQSIFLNQEGTFCDFDLSLLNGNLVSITNGCAGISGNFTDFTIDGLCVDYVGVGNGQDTACIYLMDDMGNVDTTFLIVDIMTPVSSMIFDTIRLSSPVTYCLNTSELGPDILDTVFMCDGNTSGAVIFDINNLSLCIDVEGVDVGGTDVLCFYVCDELMSCDTTTYIVTVNEDNPNPAIIAQPDIDTTEINASILIDVCENDDFPGSLGNFFVLPVDNGGVGPNLGIAFVNAECSINYIPTQDTCGIDSFSYVICDASGLGCDTATVTINIRCPSDDLKIYNAFSPNGDNVNEFFRIDGIENYPNHILYVFNRWGNQVLKTQNYSNNWNGVWEGTELPSGTYFYLLDVGDGNQHSGWVQLHR